MNNKGFAYTTIIYGLVLILGLSMLVVLQITSTETSSDKQFIRDVDNELQTCIDGGSC